MLKRILSILSMVVLSLITCWGIVACDTTSPSSQVPKPAETKAMGGVVDELRMGSLLPITGDLSAIGTPMSRAIDLLVDTVNKCGGVLGKPISYFKQDDRTDPTAGAEAITKLIQIDNVGAVVGAYASSVSTAGIAIASPNKVMMISPGSTSPVFTQRAKEGKFDGYWARTAPPDTYQAAALANLAYTKGLRKISTLVINNDYGVGFEKVFVAAFKQLGGEILNEVNPTRYDPKAATFEAEARAAFSNKPDGVVAVLYTETGGSVIKAAYELGLTKDVSILLTDGVQTEDFAKVVGKSPDGKLILAGAIGTVPGADGKSLADLTKRYTATFNQPVGAFVPHSYDAAALIAIAAEAAKSGTGEAIKGKLREIANAPGVEVTDVCEALKLVKAGTDIDFQGASGNLNLDDYGDIKGSYDVWTFTPEGKIKVIDRVSA